MHAGAVVTHPFEHLSRSAAMHPNRVAIASVDRLITYRVLFETAVRFARIFRAQGVKPGDVVGIQAAPLHYLTIVQALFHEGCVGAILPNDVDDDLFDWIIVSQPVDSFPKNRQIVLSKQFFDRVGRTPSQPDVRAFKDEDAVLQLVFSSGTTGQPKAVPITTSRVETRSLSSRQWQIGHPFFCLLGMSSLLSFVVYVSQISHGETYVVPGESKDILDQIDYWKIAAVVGSPHQLTQLLQSAADDPRSFDALLTIGSIGATLPDSTAVALQQRFGVDVVSLYGSSEGGIIARRDGLGSAQGFAGRLMDGVDVRIVDESGTEVPEGEIGLIGVKRHHQPSQYMRDEQASNEAFRDGYFYAGDMGYLKDRDLYLAGRKDELINAAGTKVDPEKIDGIALGFPHVIDAGAFGVVDEQGIDLVGLAFVDDAELNIEKFVDHMNKKLGEAAPKKYLRLDTIPRTQDTGKVMREKLAAFFNAQDPRAGREVKPARPKLIPPKL